MKIKTKTPIVILIIALSQVLLWAANVDIQILQQTDRFVHLKATFSEPEWVKENQSVVATYPQAVFTVDENGNQLPVLVKFLNMAAEHDLPLTIVTVSAQRQKVEQYLHFANPPEFKDQKVNNWAEVKFLGRMGEYPLFALRIFPVRVSADHRTVQTLKSIEIKIGQYNQNLINTSLLKNRGRKTHLTDLLKSMVINSNQTLFPVEKNKLTITAASPNSTASALARWQTILQNEIIYKLSVTEEGIYHVSYDDLLKAGFPLNKIDPQRLHLYNKGKEIPVFIKGEHDHQFNEEDYLEFWGQSNERTFQKQFPELYSDPFSDENVYWLVYKANRGERLLQESGGISTSGDQLVISPFAFRDTLHVEKNRVSHKFGHSPELVNRPAYEIDGFYFDGGVSAPGGVGYDFVIPHPAEYGAEVVVKAMFRGKSFYDSQTNPLLGHKVTLKLRGKGNVAHLVGVVNPEDGWRDQSSWVITNADSAVKIDQSALNDGLNRLEVDMFQTGVTDIVVLNWFEVSYLRKYQAYNNFLKFHVDRDFFDGRYVKLGDRIQFNIDGFDKKDIEVYKIGISKITNVDIKPVKDEETKQFSYGISFQDEVVDPSTKYVALTSDQKKSVAKIEAFRPWKQEEAQLSLLERSNQADFLIITHDIFKADCEKLKELKTQQGFKPEIVTVRDIYDQFNYGIKSPLAIKQFIRYAYKNWDQETPLEYVLLVGDASFNYRSNDDLVPTIFYNTVKFGSAESDYQYALLEGDDYLPEVIVARLPVNSTYELQNYLDKLEHFPEDPTGRWTNQTLFIAGYDGTKEYLTNKPVFRTQNLRLIQHKIPQSLFADQINSIENKARQPDPHFGSNQDVINAFNRGLSFINFVGHGGGAIWADAGLMGLDDVDRLENGYKLPFISSLTCFTSSFANSGRYSLGEKLLLSEQKGAIAFLGASGVGWIYNDFAIAWSLPDYLWNGQWTFGQAIDLMKMFYLASPFYYTEEGRFYTFGYGSVSYSQVCQYNLLGDPSLKMPFPKNKLTIKVEPENALPGDSVKLKLTQLPQLSDVVLQVLDAQNYIVFEQEYSQVNGPLKIGFRLPDDLSAQLLRIKAFATNHSQSASGFAKLSVNQPLIKRVETEPAQLQINQNVVFKVIVKTDKPIKQVRIKNIYDEISYENYNFDVVLGRLNDSVFVSQPFSGFKSGGKKIFDVELTTEDNEVILEHWNKLSVIDPRPDLLIKPNSLGWGGISNLMLTFTVENNSPNKIENIKIACFDDVISQNKPFAIQQISIDEQKEKQVAAPLPENLQYSAYHQVKVIVDYDSLLEEKDEQNNSLTANLFQNYLVVTPETGTSLDGQTHQKIQILPDWTIDIQPQATTKPFLLNFNVQNVASIISKTNQQDLKFVKNLNQKDTLGIELNFVSEDKNPKIPATFSVHLDSLNRNYSPDKISLYRFDQTLNAWILIPSQWRGNELKTTVTCSGIYAPFFTTDDNEPILEISVNGRPLIENMLVPHNPTLGILLQDVNGVNIKQSLQLKIDDNYIIKDGQLLDKSVTLPDSGSNVKNVQLVFTPELSPGKHELYLKTADVNGNIAQKTLTFTVAEGFDLIVYGNYPNPFKDQTIISYYIESNGEIDKLSVKIYATSGRLIRSKMLDLDPTVLDDNLLEPNYHELVWDGTDDDGNPVANGVYFAIIKGSYKGKTVKKILKMAKLK